MTPPSNAQWIFQTADGRTYRIQSPNWLVALGMGLEKLGVVSSIGRMVCRRMGKEMIIADDISTGQRYRLRSMRPHETVRVQAA
ncbi:MAG: hypothetical protein AAFV53_09870 [Myxococcota bacterium]